jgi:hypothetical protein
MQSPQNTMVRSPMTARASATTASAGDNTITQGRSDTMTESTDKSAEMMRFNDEQRDADMQRRISERTPVKTDPSVMRDDEDLTVAVGQLLLEHGVDVPAAALAFHVQKMLAAAADADDQEGTPRV